MIYKIMYLNLFPVEIILILNQKGVFLIVVLI